MSRREFREPVATSRPRAAFAMVALAGATLAVTGHVAPGALATALIAWGAAAALRERPRAWQRSPWLLNPALAAVVSLSVVLWTRGAPAVVALAHFALLAQALQLLDARPRRSEFLLVALSLFQVVLAASLTDSVFYPLLLVAFTVATVWTLLVHTLHAEALEAGEPEAARRALAASGLRRTVTIASLASVLLALALFPVLPRIRSGALLAAGGGDRGMAGFSDRVELGDLGEILHDPTVELRVETLEGETPPAAERYLRGIAFDHFDGRRWSVTPPGRSRVPGDPEIGIDLGGARRGVRLVQRVAREAMETGVLFAPGAARGVRGPALGRLERDANGSLFAHRTAGARVDYVIAAYTSDPGERALARDAAVPPPDAGARYLALPPLDPAVAERARRVVEGTGSDAERVRAIERHLRQEGRYSDRPPTVARGDPRSPVEVFLAGGMAGHCEYFATAMAVLVRSVGLPARVVNGFAGGAENRLGGFVEFARSDAHAWVEVHYAEAGWVRYDPTPPDLRLAGADAFRRGGGLAELASALELWWFRNVVDFDRGHQARALAGLWKRWRALRQPARTAPADDAGEGFHLPSLPGAAVAAAGAALLLGAWLWRRRRGASRGARLPDFYVEALRLVGRRGLVRGETTTARAFATRVGAALPPEGASAFHALTEAYLRERFGEAPAGAPSPALATLRAALRS